MTVTSLDTDYLVVGAGACGLAFADVIVSEDPSARLVIADRHAAPGGHWNDAYPFVELHQPAVYYGVPSVRFGHGAALAPVSEVMTYFRRVMQRLKESGRVRYLPACDVDGLRVQSLLDPASAYEVNVRRRVVDSTYVRIRVPSTRPPEYEVGEGVELIPPNQLTRTSVPRDQYVVIGAGKTALDVILFLTRMGLEPARIQWVCPNDAWLLNRAYLEPRRVLQFYLETFATLSTASSVSEVFLRSEERGHFLRVDPLRSPTKFSCATVNTRELELIRQVENIVRLGRVTRLEPDQMILEEGSIPKEGRALYIDCTASGLGRTPPRRVFDGSLLTLQSLQMCQPLFGAATIAHVEGLGLDDTERNRLCQPVPHPEVPWHYLASMKIGLSNFMEWQPVMGRWVMGCRLNYLSQEPLLSLILASFKMKRLVPRAIEQADAILRAEVPWFEEPRGLASVRAMALG